MMPWLNVRYGHKASGTRQSRELLSARPECYCVVTMVREPILIVGGGFGGLTTALALARRSYRTRVLEGAPEFGAIGDGIQFGPNVFHVFDRTGVTEQSPCHCGLAGGCGDVRCPRRPGIGADSERASFRARFGYRYIIVHRIDLHNVLLDACRDSDAIELVADAMVNGFEDRGDGVVVTTADGRTFSGQCLVAADGFRSLFRAKLVGDGEPRPTGYAALRTIVPMTELKVDIPRDSVVLWGGPGYHVIHYPLRHSSQFNIVAVFRTSTHAEKADVETYRNELDHIYRDAHPSVRALIGMMDFRWRRSVADRDPVRHWHKGRVVLLGDAAHAPLQSLAQGACMAIEDGLCLAELIDAAEGDFAAAYRKFEALRITRTARVQLESRAIWDCMLHAEGIARDLRNTTVANWDEAYLFDRLSWLYEGIRLPAKVGQ